MNANVSETVRRVADGLQGRLGCLVCDGTGKVWASHCADERFVTASVIKVPILTALAADVDAGRFRWDQRVPLDPRDEAGGSGVIQYLSPLPYTLCDLATLMIIVSDNRATNLIIDLLGPDRINGYCADAGWHGTMLGRRMYDFAARAQGRDNFSTPRDTADLFLRLHSGTLLSPPTTGQVLGILRAQQAHDKLPAWLPPEISAAHKTGELPDVQNDCGILYLPTGPVVAAVYTNDLVVPARGRLGIQEIGRAVAEAAQ